MLAASVAVIVELLLHQGGLREDQEWRHRACRLRVCAARWGLVPIGAVMLTGAAVVVASSRDTVDA